MRANPEQKFDADFETILKFVRVFKEASQNFILIYPRQAKNLKKLFAHVQKVQIFLNGLYNVCSTCQYKW